MTEKRHDEDSDDDEFGETVDLENEPIMATAEFKALVELDDEAPDEDAGEHTEDEDLTITDKLEKLTVVDDEDASDFDPYGRSE